MYDRLLRAVAIVLAGATLLLEPASAHSVERNALSRIGRVHDAVIHTPSNKLHALSSFDLSFSFGDGDVPGRRVRLALAPNHDILPEDATITYMSPDGSVHSVHPVDRLEHKVYRGEAFLLDRGDQFGWTHVGWARISVHQDGPQPVFEGAFLAYGNHHHIQTRTNYEQTRVTGDPDPGLLGDDEMVLWRDSDIEAAAGNYDELKRSLALGESCSADRLLFNRDLDHPVFRGSDSEVSLDSRDAGSSGMSSFWSAGARALLGREIDGTTGGNGAGINLANSIGSTAGCPTSRRVALVGIATDCGYSSLFPNNASVRTNIISQINLASQLYESTFNISLGIHNLSISEAACPATVATAAPWNVACSPSVTITDRLNMFSKWRGQFTDSNAYWTLLSNCSTDAAVGLAWLGQVCVQGSQTSPLDGGGNETVAAANVVVRTSTEWQVIAHETGHTFGAVHDCVSSTCSDGTVTKQQCCPLSTTTCDANQQFIMNPSTGVGITKFSPCSVGNICSAIGGQSVKIGCLTNNKDVVTITGSQCGNGIVESGEDCDCGGADGCKNNPCCNPTTCKFTTNSVCDFANEECCTHQCSFAANGTVCRPSTGVCDPQETCTGSSPVCPADVTTPDGTSCGASDAGLQCASGQCTSRDQQCKVVMGGLTHGNDTSACSPRGCQLSCGSPEFGSTCMTNSQNFLDGTTCEAGGKCKNGNCEGTSTAAEIAEFFRDNKNIIIPVASVIGGLVIIALVICCYQSWRRRRRGGGRSRKGAGPVTGPGSRVQGPLMSQADPYAAGGWERGGPQAPERAARRGGPMPPPQAYSQQWGAVKQTSARYA